MSYRFEMSNVKDSLTQLYHYVARFVGEKGWKKDPIIIDTPMETKVKFLNPKATTKVVKAENEPFSHIGVTLFKPYTPQLSVEFVSDTKKSTARFCDMLHERNRSVSESFFSMVNKLDGFTFKIQIKNTFKALPAPKYEELYSVPASEVTLDAVEENVKKVIATCEEIKMVEEGKNPTYRGLSVSICRDFSVDEIAQDESPFDTHFSLLHGFMLLEPKIESEKDIARGIRERKKIEGKVKFTTILSNRADKEFYSRISKAMFDGMADNVGIQVWDTETYEPKKYIRAALKLVSEI